MIAGRPADHRQIVHPHRMETAVYIVAETPPCIQLQHVRSCGPAGSIGCRDLLLDAAPFTARATFQ